MHAILTTRHDVRLGLHQLRLAGELAEIRAADLRFSERETRELLDASGIALSGAGAALLHQRTEGWAAGLRLAALSLAGHPDPERFVAEFSGSDRTVAEYLIAEMLERQPPDVQNLLLRTSLLDRVNGELADLLTGRPGSERILLSLEDANVFVESLDPERTWFRYHHLFADFLRPELRRTLPAEVPVLHRRAAEWFIRQGQVVDAIRHTQAAGDWAGAARLLADHSFSLTLDGQAQTMQALLRALPPGAVHPELALVRAMGDLAQGRLDETAAHLAVAEAHAGTAPPDRRRRLRVAVASLQLVLARRRGHLVGVIEQARFLASPVTGQSDEDIATSGRAPTWPVRSAGPTWKSAAWRSSGSRRWSRAQAAGRVRAAGRRRGAVWLAQFAPHTGYAAGVLGPTIVTGIGMGMVFAPAINAGTFGVAPQDAGVASATLNVGQQLGASIGISLLNSIFAAAVTAYLTAHLASARLISRQALTGQALLHGYTTAFWWTAGIFVGGAVICGALIRSGPLAQPGTPSPARGAALAQAEAEAGPGVPA